MYVGIKGKVIPKYLDNSYVCGTAFGFSTGMFNKSKNGNDTKEFDAVDFIASLWPAKYPVTENKNAKKPIMRTE